jgi:hypothetical protein
MKTLMERFFKGLFNMATAYEMNFDFAYKLRKNLIRSKPASCSLEGLIKLAFHKGCKMQVLNGPGFKNNSMATL